MNLLGLAYMNGAGVERDSALAVYWMEKAGQLDCVEAYLNLGMMFKYAKGGVRQDYERAYNYFSMGAEYEYQSRQSRGILGCRQNYSEAAECFLYATELSNKDALFMLGLCYRNGYGVEKDSVVAAYCLKQAAWYGSRDARDELKRRHEETWPHSVYSGGERYSHIPDSLPAVSCDASSAVSLDDGSYQGFLVTYDWSGKHILGEKPFSVTAARSGCGIGGLMVVGADTVSFTAALPAGNRIPFKTGGLTLDERYERGGKLKYRLDSMVLDVRGDRIAGRLNLYSPKLQEPSRPMYFELRRSGTQTET